MAAIAIEKKMKFIIEKASSLKYKSFLAMYDVYRSNSTQTLISQGFMKIGSHLMEILPLYGQKIPRKSSFFLYFVQFNSPGFQNKSSFPQNLVFFNSIRSTLTEYTKKKNLQKFLPT